MTNGQKFSGFDALSKLSGLAPSEVDRIWKEVKLNHQRLDSCRGHRFSEVQNEEGTRKRYQCAVCSGVVDASAYGWYTRGLEHGKRIES